MILIHIAISSPGVAEVSVLNQYVFGWEGLWQACFFHDPNRFWYFLWSSLVALIENSNKLENKDEAVLDY